MHRAAIFGGLFYLSESHKNQSHFWQTAAGFEFGGAIRIAGRRPRKWTRSNGRGEEALEGRPIEAISNQIICLFSQRDAKSPFIFGA